MCSLVISPVDRLFIFLLQRPRSHRALRVDEAPVVEHAGVVHDAVAIQHGVAHYETLQNYLIRIISIETD